MTTAAAPEDGMDKMDKHFLFPGRWDLPRSPSPTPSSEALGRFEEEEEANGLEVSFETDEFSESGER